MRWISALLVSLMLFGCTTMQTVDHRDWSGLPGEVEVGDDVRVTLRDGTRHDFVVREVTADALLGDGVRVPQADIATLQVQAASKGRIAAGTISVGLVAVLALFASALAGALGGG